MDLYLRGHEHKYAAEQMLLTLFPDQRPQYPDRARPGDRAELVLEPDRPEEYDHLAAASRPAYSKYLATARRRALELDAMLDMLEVRLLEISRAI